MVRILFVDALGGALAREAVQACRGLGLELQPAAASVGEGGEAAGLDGGGFDLVVLLEAPPPAGGAEAYERRKKELLASRALVGAPVLLTWRLEPEELGREVAGRLQTLVQTGALASLIDQRRRLEQVLDAVQDGVVVHDLKRRILLVNREAERLLGAGREKLLGRRCQEAFGPDGVCGSNCPFCSQEASSFRGARYEFPFIDAEGRERRLSLQSVPFDLVPGKLPGVLAVFRDVTEVSALRQRVRRKDSFHGMVAISEGMREVFDTIRNLAAAEYPVLITGESGTGKELVARAIHNESRRAGGPFVPINCGALPEHILESELFGHVRGAFTGAIRDKKGRFELAHGGTLFLDEVGELSPAFQVKLLRVLEQKSFEPVGGEKTISVDVRIISATNRDLKKMVAEGAFRADLFYRLAVVPVKLPPLRQRREDLPLLIEQILEGVRAETQKDIRAVADQVMDLFWAYRWPGNIRELINVLQFASVRCVGPLIEVQHLPPEVRRPVNQPAEPPLARMVNETELTPQAVREALEKSRGNKLQAARLLGVGRATLYRFLKKMSAETVSPSETAGEKE
jgi:PAS domain S-box-containing protein